MGPRDRTATKASTLAKSISDHRDDQTGCLLQQNTKPLLFLSRCWTGKGHEVVSGVSNLPRSWPGGDKQVNSHGNVCLRPVYLNGCSYTALKIT